jgi:transposase-like protein
VCEAILIPRRDDGQDADEFPTFDPAELDALIRDARSPEDFLALVRALQKRVAERMLAGELTAHLGSAAGEAKPAGQRNHRNGTTPETVLTDTGAVPLAIPRAREGSVRPQLVPTGVRRLPQFDATVLSLFACGMTVREIHAHLEQLYQVEVAPGVISAITDKVPADVQAWQQRPLDRLHPVVILDALRVKIRDEGTVRNKAVYLALGVDRDGQKSVLGLWIEQTEGAGFWLRVMSELKARGVEDILVALVDGLVGFPEAITTVFPQSQVHHCVVHLVRQRLAFASWKARKPLGAALRGVYRAPTLDAATAARDAFATSTWGTKSPAIVALWRRRWPYVEPVFPYPPELRRLLYTTNAIETLHMQLWKIVKTRGHVPTDEAAATLLSLALRNIEAKRKRGSPAWKAALPYFALLFRERFTDHT